MTSKVLTFISNGISKYTPLPTSYDTLSANTFVSNLVTANNIDTTNLSVTTFTSNNLVANIITANIGNIVNINANNIVANTFSVSTFSANNLSGNIITANIGNIVTINSNVITANSIVPTDLYVPTNTTLGNIVPTSQAVRMAYSGAGSLLVMNAAATGFSTLVTPALIDTAVRSQTEGGNVYSGNKILISSCAFIINIDSTSGTSLVLSSNITSNINVSSVTITPNPITSATTGNLSVAVNFNNTILNGAAVSDGSLLPTSGFLSFVPSVVTPDASGNFVTMNPQWTVPLDGDISNDGAIITAQSLWSLYNATASNFSFARLNLIDVGLGS